MYISGFRENASRRKLHCAFTSSKILKVSEFGNQVESNWVFQ